jgi:hypothetical protein
MWLVALVGLQGERADGGSYRSYEQALNASRRFLGAFRGFAYAEIRYQAPPKKSAPRYRRSEARR